ncbi:MAG: TrkA family potassium uptake protein, partial [Bacteroidota bacterium]
MAKKIAVIGLGHFGFELATELGEKGAEVLALDDDMERLDDIKDRVAHTVCLDSTEEKAMRGQGLEEFDAVVVAIGDEFEATLMTVAVLQTLKIKRIIVRATTEMHKKILSHLGVREIILPAVEAAGRLANSLLFERIIDSFSLSSDFTIMEVNAPVRFHGKTIEAVDIPGKHSVTLITIKRREEY